MSKIILLICPYPLDTVPGQRLKYEQYLPFLRSQGYHIEIHSFFGLKAFQGLYSSGRVMQKVLAVLHGLWKRALLAFRISSADGIYVFLNVAPLGPPVFEWLYLKLARSTIYDIDDMVHLLRTSSMNKLARVFKSSQRYFMMMKGARHIITCTPTLDSLVRRFNANTTDISSTVNTHTYRPVNTYSNDKELVIGWSGSHSTAPYLHLLDTVFQELAARFNFKLLVMGAPSFELAGVEVELVEWSVDSEIPCLQRIDIGVYPLPNDPWVNGKSGLKAIQYMALGIPTVASAMGCNDRVIEDGISGYLVSSHDAWVLRLSQLLLNPPMRRSIGSAARDRVERLFSVEANQHKYLSIFKAVYG